MNEPRESAENTAAMTTLAGVSAIVLGYTMPAIMFRGSGNVVHDLSMIEKLPVLSGLAFVALAAALATALLPRFRRYAEPATVAAIVLALAPALWGFISAIDAWSGLRATIVQMAGTRNVIIHPAAGYVPMLVGAGLLAISLRSRRAAERGA